jgi:hypothetical protein
MERKDATGWIGIEAMLTIRRSRLEAVLMYVAVSSTLRTEKEVGGRIQRQYKGWRGGMLAETL